jgi:glucose dehydrogenase
LEESFWDERVGIPSLDAEHGIAYMPFGEPTTDFWGGDRKGANLNGTSLVAADALTGKIKWYFQGVHHDTWDYDFASPPDLLVKALNLAKLGKHPAAIKELRETLLKEPFFGALCAESSGC